MGFLKSIGNAISGIAKGVSKVAGTVGNIAGNIKNLMQAPLSQLAEPIKNLAGKALDKLPFGIGKMIKPFAEKFMDKGLSALSGTTLGGLSIFAKAMPTVSKIADLATKIADVANKIGQDFGQQGQANLQHVFAHAHAQKVAQQ